MQHVLLLTFLAIVLFGCILLLLDFILDRLLLLKEELLSQLTGTLYGRDPLTRDILSDDSLLAGDILIDEGLTLSHWSMIGSFISGQIFLTGTWNTLLELCTCTMCILPN